MSPEPIALQERNDHGLLWENFVITELYKQRRNAGGGDQFYFWRSRGQAEVDLVIRSAGRYEAYECKFSPKRAKIKLPDSFVKRYEPTTTAVIHTENFFQVFG